jgi:hypothetical protein
VQVAGATLYRHAELGGRFSAATNTSTSVGLRAWPSVELCSWLEGCAALGQGADPFAPVNRVDVVPGSVDGFNVVLGCESFSCTPTGAERVVLAGGLVTLRDGATPRVVEPATGGLATDRALAPTATLAFRATDEGAGLHRVIATIDGTEVAARPLCQADGLHEFATPTPCPGELAPDLAFDTTGWPRAGRLRVYLEDAGRNTAVLVNRPIGG